MNISKKLLPFSLFLILLSSCVVNKINTAAISDYSGARQTIEDIKIKGVVVIFPTDYKKERVLRNISESRPQVREEIEKIKLRRKNRWNLWKSAIDNYSFSNISVVPDSLLKSYIENPDRVTSISNSGNNQEVELNSIYVLYTEFGGFEVKQNGSFVPNPFPNQVRPSKWASIRDFLGVQGDEKSVNSFFAKLNNSFNGFYALIKAEN